MSESLKLYKLIILYMLSKVNFPLTNSQISEFIIEHEYTNYFTVQKALAEAIESELIRPETTYKKTIYHLTPSGIETNTYFHTDLSPDIREEIDGYLAEKKFALKNDTDVISDYYKNTNGEFSVNLQIRDNHASLIDLTISVPTESVAESIANNWNNKNQEVYSLLMKHLL